MSGVQIRTVVDNERARIALSGRFEFTSHRAFHDAYQEPLDDPVVKQIEIDLGGVEYLDSSALGMLLLLREKAGGSNKVMSLVNCHGLVLEILEIANFSKLFAIN